MSFDGITLRSVIKDLKKTVGLRISKVNQPNKNSIVLVINKDLKIYLTIDPNSPRVHLIDENLANPLDAPNFCMMLRKNISSGIILDIWQDGLDRVMGIDIRTYSELGEVSVKSLIIEIMCKHSNLILIDKESSRIIDVMKKVTLDMSRVRQLLPGDIYTPIGSSKINFLEDPRTPKDLFDYSKTSKTLKEFYMVYDGIGPMFGRVLLSSIGLPEDIKLNLMTEEEKEGLDEAFISYREKIRNEEFSPTIYFDEMGKASSFYPFLVEGHAPSYESFEKGSRMVSSYYGLNENNDQVIEKKTSLLKIVNNQLKKKTTKLQNQFNEYQASKDRDKYKVWADLISANQYRIDPGMKEVTLENFYSEDLEPIVIQLDEKLPAHANAGKYYKLYSKLKSRENVLEVEIKISKEEVSYLESLKSQLESDLSLAEFLEIEEELIEGGYKKKKSRKSKKSKKEAESRPLEYISSSGSKIYVGKNNRQNDNLTIKFADREDIFFHVQTFPGSHVILRNSGRDFTEEEILEAAYLAASHSSLKNEKLVTVDYTERKNVFKRRGARPGMVNYKNFSSITVDLSDKSIEEKIREAGSK